MNRHTDDSDYFSHSLLTWFDQHGRKNLPWQKQVTPYRVWISEIMLQQTQVNTVIPYFQRFMHAFPHLKRLAQAELDEVLHLWTGLGYYARARNLHRSAQIIAQEKHGRWPRHIDELCQLPGIGRSTAGAIISLSMRKEGMQKSGPQRKAPILDGNVKRVLCRFHTVAGWPDQAATQKQLWTLAESYTPLEQVANYTQAIMDLGATVCSRSQANCKVCPLQPKCAAYNTGTVALYPHKKPKKKLPVKSTHMLIMQTDNKRVLLEQRPPQGIWGSLWSFPECQEKSEIDRLSHKFTAANNTLKETWEPLRHTFSHFHLDITPVFIAIPPIQPSIMEAQRWLWYDLHKPQSVGLAAPVKQLLGQLMKRDLK